MLSLFDMRHPIRVKNFKTRIDDITGYKILCSNNVGTIHGEDSHRFKRVMRIVILE